MNKTTSPHYFFKTFASRGALVSLALLLSGCILVNDFGTFWSKGVADICTSKIAESLYFSEFRRNPDGKDMGKLAHSFKLGDKYFLMLKQEESDHGGRMYRFGVVQGIFQRYRLNPAKREDFLRDHPNAPVSFKHDTVTLDKIDDGSIKLLKEISAKPDYWEIEDQTLYNTILNPMCQFDDRDVKKLIEERKPKVKANDPHA